MIWIVSDSHLADDQILPAAFTNRVGREDIILHLGDIISPGALGLFESLCRVEAVHGNCDSPRLRKKLPTRKIIEIENKKIGMVHGNGVLSDALKNVKREEFIPLVDVVLFGHSHISHISWDNNIMFFNPGSLTDGRNGYNSFGRLRLDHELWAEIIEI